VAISPIGFVSDHLEVLFDLDVEAREVAERFGLKMARAGTAGTHPAFVSAIREAIAERLSDAEPRRAVGRFGPSHDTCAPDCCLPGTGRPSPWDA
jgi:ferrochelatase